MLTQPNFIYGTAWKTSATANLVKLAIASGFKAIDTANQPKHYSESLVGDALAELCQQGLSRSAIFLQTKFTPADGHDQRIPYDPHTSVAAQVQTSFKKSLEHLKTDYVDSYLLHSPYGWPSLIEEDWQVWHEFEKIYETGQAKLIGVSNINSHQLELLVNQAKIKPMVVQNRCFAHQGWDRKIRDFCLQNNIMYQGFSLLTANLEQVLQHPKIIELGKRLHKTPAQIIFRFAIHAGMVPLTGTSNEKHMQEDLAIFDFELTQDEINRIEEIS